ncbi:HdeD family acid-resistance protein [Chachezhania antarctica]|uniref:HdeD family acid-resistance protein n=1 Tax=Chachezhania antarctica TaxID=2340860 RepID=UPI000EAE1756|nr:DUF308 domain-containing protein [Chachezhania antarctica]|tara:strand:+ start:152 stop:676 length:525 start_codon:yes stop_codon:yes gene_type:complete
MSDWLKFLLLGIASVVFGIFALGNTVAASMAVVYVTGALFLVAGVIQIWGGVTTEDMGNRVLTILMGVLAVLLGGSFLYNPLEGAVSLSLLILILMGLSGIVRLVLAWSMRQSPFFWAMLISGALSIVLAGYIWANFGAISTSLLGILLGIELIFNGAGFIVMALFIRSVRRKV